MVLRLKMNSNKGTLKHFFSLLGCLYLFVLPTISYALEPLIKQLVEGDFKTQLFVESSSKRVNLDSVILYDKTALFNFSLNPSEDTTFDVFVHANEYLGRYETHETYLYFAELTYLKTLNDLDFQLSALYYMNTYEAALSDYSSEAEAFAFKTSMTYDSLETYLAYSRVKDGSMNANSYLNPKGQLLPTTPLLHSSNYEPDTHTYALHFSYDIAETFTLGTRYVIVEDAFGSAQYSGIYGLYTPHADLSIKMTYEQAFDEQEDSKVYLRMGHSF